MRMMANMDIIQAGVTAALGVVFGLVMSGLTFTLLKGRLIAAVMGAADSYKDALLADVKENPGEYVEQLKPLVPFVVKAFMDEIGAQTAGSKSKPLKFGPLSIPGELAGMIMERFLGPGKKADVAGKLAESLIH